MTPLVAVDPGVHACGAAWFHDDGELYIAALVARNEWPLAALLGESRCVCEKPQVYHGRGKVRAADLVDLAIAAGRATALLSTTYVRPAEWKGQLPKKIHHARVRAALSVDERGLLDADLAQVPKGLRHNVLDAVALGLRTLGRI